MEIKITVVKFETENGRKTGRSFSFGMDPKKMAKYKTEAAVRKKIEEYVAKNGVFKRDELKGLRYDMKDFLDEWRKQLPIVEEKERKNREESVNNPESRVTPDAITRLANNEIFVFGSNAQGMHYGGAARYALDHFGAIMGQGVGPQGKSYAIPSMGGLASMGEAIKQFCQYAKAHPEKRFLVTPIGCGIAGRVLNMFCYTGGFSFYALRGYQKLNAAALQRMPSGSILFTFSCSQVVTKDDFRLAVFSAAAQVGRRVRILYQLHQPADHPINIYHPEGEYLKGLVLYVE